MANIQFNNIKEIGLPMDSTLGIVGLPEDAIAENGGIINAVQIDWNGAQVAGKTLNTTGEVLSLIGDNNEDIKTLKQHSHANYATQSYVTDKIKEASISGGGSGLDVEEYTDTANYNLLVAPKGSKYTELGSLSDGGTWTSQLYATVDQYNNGDTTLYSTYFDGTLIGKFAHSHANYATTGHSHGNYTTSIENLEDQITYLTSRINDLEELIGGGSVTPTIPEITGVTVKVTGGIYGTNGMTGTLNDNYEMRMFDDGTSDKLDFVLTANPSTANATFMINYDDNRNSDIYDKLATVNSSKITNGLYVTATMNSNSEEWQDGDWTRYKVNASNSESFYESSLFIQLSYVFLDDLGDYFYVGQTQPTASNYRTLATQVTDYPSTYEYTNTSGSRGYAYVILHNSKTLTAVEKVSQATVNFTKDTTSIPGYNIYKTTVGIAVNGVIMITIK